MKIGVFPSPWPWRTLPRYTRIEADLVRRAAALVPRARAGLAALEERLGVTLRPTAVVERAVAAPERPGTTVTLIDERGTRAHVWIDGALVGPLGARLRGEPLDDEIAAARPATLVERGLCAYLVAWALDLVAAPLLVEDVAAASPSLRPGDIMVSVDLAVRAGSARGFVRIYAPPALLAPPERPWSDLLLERLPLAPVVIRVLAGRARVSEADLERVRPRALVILDVPPGGLFLAAGDGGFAARRDGDAAVVTHIYGRGFPMSEPTEPDGKDAIARDLPIELTCEIARLTLPARDVLGLAPGAILPLGRRVGDPVELVCAGRTVARGELVDLEGELGMRVLEEL